MLQNSPTQEGLSAHEAQAEFTSAVTSAVDDFLSHTDEGSNAKRQRGVSKLPALGQLALEIGD